MSVVEVLLKIRTCASVASELDYETIVDWVRLNSEEILLELLTCFVERRLECTDAAELFLADSMLTFLLDTDSTSRLELTFAEKLEYLRALFHIFWERPAKWADPLKRLKGGLGILVSKWPEPDADLVVTVVLEHLFELDSIRDFFSDWLASPNLKPVFLEAINLSDGFRSM